jgi:hypothetical protein
MEKQKDGEENSLPPLINQPQAEFLAKFLGSCRIVTETPLWGGRGLDALQPNPLGFVALVESSAGNVSGMSLERGISIRKVETRGAFGRHSI